MRYKEKKIVRVYVLCLKNRSVDKKEFDGMIKPPNERRGIHTRFDIGLRWVRGVARKSLKPAANNNNNLLNNSG